MFSHPKNMRTQYEDCLKMGSYLPYLVYLYLNKIMCRTFHVSTIISWLYKIFIFLIVVLLEAKKRDNFT